MEPSPLAATLNYINTIVNGIEPAPIVKGCIFDYGCPVHIERLSQTLLQDIEDNKEYLVKEITKHCAKYYLSVNQTIYKNLDYLAQHINEHDFARDTSQGGKGNSSRKREKRIDVQKVWATDRPLLFCDNAETERRLSSGLADMSFSEDEFTLGPEIKKMITALVE